MQKCFCSSCGRRLCASCRARVAATAWLVAICWRLPCARRAVMPLDRWVAVIAIKCPEKGDLQGKPLSKEDAATIHSLLETTTDRKAVIFCIAMCFKKLPLCKKTLFFWKIKEIANFQVKRKSSCSNWAAMWRASGSRRRTRWNRFVYWRILKVKQDFSTCLYRIARKDHVLWK